MSKNCSEFDGGYEGALSRGPFLSGPLGAEKWTGDPSLGVVCQLFFSEGCPFCMVFWRGKLKTPPLIVKFPLFSDKPMVKIGEALKLSFVWFSGTSLFGPPFWNGVAFVFHQKGSTLRNLLVGFKVRTHGWFPLASKPPKDP